MLRIGFMVHEFSYITFSFLQIHFLSFQGFTEIKLGKRHVQKHE